MIVHAVCPAVLEQVLADETWQDLQPQQQVEATPWQVVRGCPDATSERSTSPSTQSDPP